MPSVVHNRDEIREGVALMGDYLDWNCCEVGDLVAEYFTHR